MTEALLKGLTIGLILALSVGPVIFTVIKQSINNGYKGGFSFVAGVWLSDIFLVVLSNAFSEWVTTILQYKKAIGYIGSGFLIAMGVFFVFFKKVTSAADASVGELRFRKRDVAKIAFAGFLINTLNPSVILFWLINATAFAVSHTMQQRIIIFSSCLLLNIIADVLKVLMAGKLRQRLTVKNISIINKLSGTILLGFGIALLYGAIFLADKVK
ncbi:MAG: LysE family translocator [Flavihumibacter sp.]|nr:LysE family translocator [Flavihumibacter sp.]